MKDLRFAILGALAILLGLMTTFAVMFWWKSRDPSFRFPGPGHADFSAHLAGDYHVFRTSGLNVVIAPETWSDGKPVIPNLVVECATDGRFIIAKRHGMKRRSPDNPNDTFEIMDHDHVDFWILDTNGPSLDGPLTETAFLSRRRALPIPESVVLRNVYEFRPVASDAGSSKALN